MASTQVEMERGRIHGLGRGWPAAAGGAESTLAGGESGTATTAKTGSRRGIHFGRRGIGHRDYFRSWLEARNVRSFRYCNQQRLVFALGGEVLIQLLPQVTDLNADDVIFVGVEIRFAAKRVAADFVFFDAGGGIGEGALADVNQDLMEMKRCRPRSTFRPAPAQSP